jgi:uncharacterized membrane protein
MKCPKCDNENVNIQAITTIKKKHHGMGYWIYFICFGWIISLVMWLIFTIPMLLIKLFKSDKYVSKTHKEAICQGCGYSWKI